MNKFIYKNKLNYFFIIMSDIDNISFEELKTKYNELLLENEKNKNTIKIQAQEYRDIYKKLKEYNQELIDTNDNLRNINLKLSYEALSLRVEMLNPPILRI